VQHRGLAGAVRSDEVKRLTFAEAQVCTWSIAKRCCLGAARKRVEVGDRDGVLPFYSIACRPLTLPSRGSEIGIDTNQGTHLQPQAAFHLAWDAEDGNPGGDATEVTLEFRPIAIGTRLVLAHTGFTDRDSRDKHARGWSSCIDSLELYLAGKLTTCG
jgi:hypothetical protein